MKYTVKMLAVILFASLAPVQAAEHLVQPGDSPQEVFDRAAAGDRLVFLPGLHQHGLGKHRAILYVDKSMEIELKEGATLKLAPRAARLEADGEITTDQDAAKKLDDLEIGGQFDLSRPAVDGPESYGNTIYTVVIDGVGADGQPDTFAWGDGKIFDTPHKQVPITGDWQKLSHGVKIRFGSRTGHSLRSLWFVSYDGPEAYGIRIGHGRQTEYIENVRIVGRGTIDLNASHNALPSGLVKNINACVLIHGRVRGVLVEGITMTDTMRSVMAYGEHTGGFLPGGKIGPGESFDAEDITVQRTRTINPNGSGYLFGHPSHRGHIRNVRCNQNYMETALTAIEPNFNLDGYEVLVNVIKSGGQAIHCWRHSTGGVVADNLRIHDNTGKPVVVVNSPRGWETPEPPVLRNNRNHLSDALPKASPKRLHGNATPESKARAADPRAFAPEPKQAEAPRPTLQIINGSRQPIDVYWLKSDRERVSNGTVEPGKDTIISTTLGHRFALVGQEDKSEVIVTSEVRVQAFRFDPPDKNGVPDFYTQRVSAGGFPIVASARVNPYALKEATYLVDLMLAKRPDVREAMIKSGSRLCILAWNEFTTDQPEWAWLAESPVPGFPGLSAKDFRDARARGMGGSPTDPFCSCGEENLLGYPGDPYAAENILIHEFAHNIHLRGMVNVDPTFDARVKAAYDAAMQAGLWKGKYPSVNHHEYFAEGVQSWFDNNRVNDHDHNHVHLRSQLIEYDPGLAALCREVFGDTEIKYTKPATRLTGHLAGYDPAQAPTFVWPKRLTEAQRQIKEAARARDAKANGSKAQIIRETRDVSGFFPFTRDELKRHDPEIFALLEKLWRTTE